MHNVECASAKPWRDALQSVPISGYPEANIYSDSRTRETGKSDLETERHKDKTFILLSKTNITSGRHHCRRQYLRLTPALRS